MDLAGRVVRRFRGDPDEPMIAGIDDEDADQLFDALGSETSRAVLAACYEAGRTRSELADELETSIQNVSYHVDKLESAGLLEAVETRYGANGSEVLVYEPSKQAVVIAAGETGFADRLAAAVDKLFAPVALAGLLSLVVGVLVRGPGPIGLMGGSSAITGTARTQTEFLVAGGTFVCTLLAVFAAARSGVFDSDEPGDGLREGLLRSLLGRRVGTTRRYAVSIACLALGTFLTLDLIVVGAGPRMTAAAWFAIQLVVPGGVAVAAAVAYSNDGLLLSWGAVSAPVVGIWCYVVASFHARGGFEPILIALGPGVVASVAAPVGSIVYLVGRTVAGRRREADTESLTGRAVTLLLAHPLVAGAIVAGWLVLSG